MRKDKKLTVCGLLIGLFLPAANAQLFTVKDLGTLGGSISLATSVNIFGQVVGQSAVVNETASHSFLWTKNRGLRDLGTLGGFSSRPYHINALSQVVGESFTAGNLTSHAFLWTQSQGMQDLGTLGGCSSLAEGINFFGQAVGGSMVTGCDFSEFHGFLCRRAQRHKASTQRHVLGTVIAAAAFFGSSHVPRVSLDEGKRYARYRHARRPFQ